MMVQVHGAESDNIIDMLKLIHINYKNYIKRYLFCDQKIPMLTL